jgi:hypothetical protein
MPIYGGTRRACGAKMGSRPSPVHRPDASNPAGQHDGVCPAHHAHAAPHAGRQHQDSGSHQKLVNSSQDTAYRDILDLTERGALPKDPGGGRSTSYSLVTDDAR